MTESSITNSTVVRLFELYRKIPSAKGAGISTKSLHQYLIDEGFEVSKRTVERDLIKLQDITGIYSELTPEGNIWKNSALNLDLLPTMQPTEALMLIVAERLLKHTLPPDSKDLLENRLGKARKTLDKSNRLNKWEDKLYIVEGQIPHTNNKADSSLLAEIYEAVLNEVKLSLTYQKLSSDKPIQYLLNPLAIIVRDHAHYLVATKAESPEKPQLFNFSRMIEAESLVTSLTRPKEFAVKDYINSNPTGWLISPKEQTISMRVRWYAYEWLQHNQLHSTQELKVIDNEWYLLTMKAQVTYDLVGWILRFSTDVEVLEPNILVKEIVSRLQQMITYYED